MKKIVRTYTVFQIDPDYRDEEGSMRILEDKGCGHKHKTFLAAWKCHVKKAYTRDRKVNDEWYGSRIRENASGFIYCEGGWDNFRRRAVYRTRYIDGRLFYTTKYPECPPDIARLFDWNVRKALTPQELMVVDLKMLNLPDSAPYDTPLYLRSDGRRRMIAYQDEVGICDENPYGTKSMENTCGYCGKTGFKKVVDPKTLYTHNQKCDACGGEIMIDSWYFEKYFRNSEAVVMPKQKSTSYLDNKVDLPEEKTTSFLHLDDAEMGKLVKNLATSIQDHKGNDSLAFTACATLLACITAGRNMTSATTNLAGLTDDGKELGDWKLTVRRVSAPSEQEEFHAFSEDGLSAVWASENDLGRSNLVVYQRLSDGKYIPSCDGVHDEPVDSQAAARVIVYQMRLKQVTDNLEREIDKIPKRI